MRFRTLGRTGLQVSVLSFGAGPVSGWTVADRAEQTEVVRAALAAGINWFDTAATYSDGRSELSLGAILKSLKARHQVHLATKVRLTEGSAANLRAAIRDSVAASLERLQVRHVTLLQLHNSITRRAGDLPTSVTPEMVLDPGGILDAFRELQATGMVRHLGVTGLGHPDSLRRVLETAAIDTIQTPFHLLNPTAGQAPPAGFPEENYGNLFEVCQRLHMGVFAIRVFAGGALADREPSAHTRVTKFFPLDLYERDRARAAELARQLTPGESLPAAALRFSLAHPAVTSALIGFANPDEVQAAAGWIP